MSSKTSDAALLRASRIGDLSAAESAIANSADVNCTDQFGLRPILLASQRCDHAMVSLLMKKGANPRCIGADGMYPMALAAVSDRVDVIDALGAHCWDVESPSDLMPSALENALQAGRDYSARHLIKHGSQLESLGLQGETLLTRCAFAGQHLSVRLLAEEGSLWFAIDDRGFNAWNYANRLNHTKIKPILLELARSEPLISTKKTFPLPLVAQPEFTRKDADLLQVEQSQDDLQHIRDMLSRHVKSQSSSAFEARKVAKPSTLLDPVGALKTPNTPNTLDPLNPSFAEVMSDNAVSVVNVIDPECVVEAELAAMGLSANNDVFQETDEAWSSHLDASRKAPFRERMTQWVQLKGFLFKAACRKKVNALKVEIKIAASSMNHFRLHIAECARWAMPARLKELKATRTFIAALEKDDLGTAWSLLLKGSILMDARTSCGTPLVVEVVRALNRSPNAATTDFLDPDSEDAAGLAFKILKLMALSNVHTNSSDALTGASMAHAFIEGNHCNVYFKLIDQQLYTGTLNRSNVRGERPIHIACKKRDVAAINGLLARGCDRNPVNKAGHSPLHHCAINGDPSIAELLIAAGANVKLKTRRGQSIETMLKGVSSRIEDFNALLEARRDIDKVMSVFSSNHPLAAAVRAKQVNQVNQNALKPVLKKPPNLPGPTGPTGPAGPTGPTRTPGPAGSAPKKKKSPDSGAP